MTPRRDIRRRRGLTLVELVVSMLAATTLLAGMGSTMFIALRAADPTKTPAASVLAAAACAADMIADLQYATALSSATATGVTATVPDRNNDAVAETIRYAWSGAGQPIVRQYNAGAAATALDAVQSFEIQYYPSAAAPQYLVLRIQPTPQASSLVETYVPLSNMP